MSNSNTTPKFNRGLAALRLNRQMQRDRLKYGIDFIDSYIKDVEGDWLENWGKTEASAEETPKATLLEKNANRTPQLINKVRSIFDKWQVPLPGNTDINELSERIVNELARVISSIESDEWLYEIAETLEKVCLGKSELEVASLTRNRPELENYDEDEDEDEDDEEWLDIAEELLEEVEATWDIPEKE
ncbi:MAG: hypothetical protein HC764_24840 [Pleurocapsa sp. CRU_1_2]|nr:hypothetical protein [Pleurocapsa sp. CRU_1_2]